MKPLVIPPAAQRDENSIQMLSAWIAENGLHCSLNIGMWQDNHKGETSAWAILLADTIRHIANALNERYGFDQVNSIDEILNKLKTELENPTSTAKGNFHQGHH